MTIVDKAHPITKGVEDFEITDESYNCVFFEESVHPLIRTDFDPKNAPPSGTAPHRGCWTRRWHPAIWRRT